MKIKKRYKIAVFGLAIILSSLFPLSVFGFEPWSNVDGKWIAADGKSVIEGALKKGVTITKYQNRSGNIDWNQLIKDNISFVMVRLGYYHDLDPYFKSNMSGSQEAKLDTGVCFYGKAVDVEGAKQEARYVLEIVKDYRISYPIAYDVESEDLLEKGLTKAQITEQVGAFCKVIEDAGYKAMIFGEHEWLTQHLDMKKLDYDVWYSCYGITNNFDNRTLWRCTDQGSVKGIEGNVCLEFAFEDYEKSFPADGWRVINGKRYYFKNHWLAKDIALQIEGVVYFFDKEGNLKLTN